jgi:hypothetical protein
VFIRYQIGTAKFLVRPYEAHTIILLFNDRNYLILGGGPVMDGPAILLGLVSDVAISLHITMNF